MHGPDATSPCAQLCFVKHLIPLQELKRKEEAEACFRQVVALRPTCALSLGNLAGVYYEQVRAARVLPTNHLLMILSPVAACVHLHLGEHAWWASF